MNRSRQKKALEEESAMNEQCKLFAEPPIEVADFSGMTEAEIAAMCLTRSVERLKPNERRFCFKIARLGERLSARDRERLARIAQQVAWRPQPDHQGDNMTVNLFGEVTPIPVEPPQSIETLQARIMSLNMTSKNWTTTNVLRMSWKPQPFIDLMTMKRMKKLLCCPVALTPFAPKLNEAISNTRWC
jgi:hypothetical protein